MQKVQDGEIIESRLIRPKNINHGGHGVPQRAPYPMEGRLGARCPMSAGNLVAIQGEVSV